MHPFNMNLSVTENEIRLIGSRSISITQPLHYEYLKKFIKNVADFISYLKVYLKLDSFDYRSANLEKRLLEFIQNTQPFF